MLSLLLPRHICSVSSLLLSFGLKHFPVACLQQSFQRAFAGTLWQAPASHRPRFRVSFLVLDSSIHYSQLAFCQSLSTCVGVLFFQSMSHHQSPQQCQPPSSLQHRTHLGRSLTSSFIQPLFQHAGGFLLSFACQMWPALSWLAVLLGQMVYTLWRPLPVCPTSYCLPVQSLGACATAAWSSLLVLQNAICDSYPSGPVIHPLTSDWFSPLPLPSPLPFGRDVCGFIGSVSWSHLGLHAYRAMLSVFTPSAFGSIADASALQ